MNATTNPTPVSPAQRWSALAPTTPTLSTADYAEFFATAGTGTVVQVWDDLFSRLPDGDWANLNEVVQGDGEYTASTNAYSTSEEMASWAVRDARGVTVLRLR